MWSVIENLKEWSGEVISRANTIERIASEVSTAEGVEIKQTYEDGAFLYEATFPSGNANFATRLVEIPNIDGSRELLTTGSGRLELNSGKHYALTAREVSVLEDSSRRRTTSSKS